MSRNTILTINIDNLLFNLDYLKRINHKNIIPVIKADAYGTCDFYVAKLLASKGIKLVAVSSIDEAIHLRRHGIDIDILILGYVSIEDLSLVKQYDLSIITVNEDYIFGLNDELRTIKFHIKIDTGMHRLGIQGENISEILNHLIDHGAIVEGIMTHFAKSDEKDEEYTKLQFERFNEAIKKADYSFKYIHCDNTDASLNFKDDVTNYMRIGLGMWGYSSFESKLKPCLELTSEIVECKSLNKGEALGYGLKYESDGSGYISILPIGYADGLLRNNSMRSVCIEGEKATIVGNICMDQCFIKTSKPYELHTKVEIFGSHIPLEMMAQELNVIPYEIITNISDRVKRVFVDSDDNILFEIIKRFE